MFSFEDYGELLVLMQNPLIAAIALGIVGGLAGVFIMQRDMAFAVHGISELSFAGAALALLLGGSVEETLGSLAGAIVAAVIIGVLGARARDRNSIVGVLMPFGLGLGILFISMYNGRSANRFSLLTGQIVAVSDTDLTWLIGICLVVLAGDSSCSGTPCGSIRSTRRAAEARGIPVQGLSIAFMLLLGAIVAATVHIIGALLVMALLVTPAAPLPCA